MTPLERRRFALHSEEADYRSRVSQALDWIHETFGRFDAPCLHVSGGKDSLVLWHLTTVRAGYQSVPVYHFDNGLLSVPGDTSFVRLLADRFGGRLFVRSSEAAQSAEMVREQGHGYAGYWGQYSSLADAHGWDCRVLGIRAGESPQRRDRFDRPDAASDDALPLSTGDQYRTAVAPIHRLTTTDVWAYIVEHDLPYHDSYDERGDLFGDIAHPQNRLVTIYDDEFRSHGSFELSQFLLPDATSRAKQADHDAPAADDLPPE